MGCREKATSRGKKEHPRGRNFSAVQQSASSCSKDRTTRTCLKSWPIQCFSDGMKRVKGSTVTSLRDNHMIFQRLQTCDFTLPHNHSSQVKTVTRLKRKERYRGHDSRKQKLHDLSIDSRE